MLLKILKVLILNQLIIFFIKLIKLFKMLKKYKENLIIINQLILKIDIKQNKRCITWKIIYYL
ncbi:hypothetical protein P344_03465 [Spiroplasma mirum ATCC 29335]|uniref:Transmembrane protein n=1 Tax=Spiroplasma mirum ATCC 29335 TaxID=838561 RepID=W6AMT6_9MOLU|nr:hypothetical protein P344_03465 [Spiroplasma mirum ATCC 29335]